MSILYEAMIFRMGAKDHHLKQVLRKPPRNDIRRCCSSAISDEWRLEEDQPYSGRFMI